MEETISPGFINKLLIQVSRQHFTRLHALMETIGLHRGQPPLLHVLWEEEGCTQSDLAARLHSQPATVTKMLQRMESAGFIERRPDPEDQRVSRVYLAEAGRAVKAAVCERDHQVGQEILAGFTAEEQAQLVQFLSRIRDNLLQVNGELQDCDLCVHHRHPKNSPSRMFDSPQEGEAHPDKHSTKAL